MDVGFTIKSYIQKVKEPYRPRSGALYVSMRMCHLQVVNSRHFFNFHSHYLTMSQQSPLRKATTVSLQLKTTHATHTIIIWRSVLTSPDVLVQKCLVQIFRHTCTSASTDKCIVRVMIPSIKDCGLGGLCTGVEIVELDNLMSTWHNDVKTQTGFWDKRCSFVQRHHHRQSV